MKKSALRNKKEWQSGQKSDLEKEVFDLRKNRSGNPIVLVVGAVAVVLLAIAGLTVHHVMASQEQSASLIRKE
ncbi:MAG: hypothetical protein HFE39_06395 [Clostridiales bacterium]|nr:hypothetical protein [Clostridiales bacterium]